MYTEGEKDVIHLMKWCGKDFPYCFDVEIKEEDGTVIETEIAGGEENTVQESYTTVNGWDELLDLARNSSMKKNGFQVTAIFNYQVNKPIMFYGLNNQ